MLFLHVCNKTQVEKMFEKRIGTSFVHDSDLDFVLQQAVENIYKV